MKWLLVTRSTVVALDLDSDHLVLGPPGSGKNKPPRAPSRIPLWRRLSEYRRSNFWGASVESSWLAGQQTTRFRRTRSKRMYDGVPKPAVRKRRRCRAERRFPRRASAACERLQSVQEWRAYLIWISQSVRLNFNIQDPRSFLDRAIAKLHARIIHVPQDRDPSRLQ